MKTLTPLFLFALLAGAARAEEKSPAPQPRLKIDPVSHQPVMHAVAEAPSTAPVADASPPVVMMNSYYVRSRGAVPREAPKQEVVQGPFSAAKGGEIWRGKVGKSEATVGFWPYLDFTKPASTSYREGGPRLNVDFLRINW